jgi:hypothetical protein
MVCEHGKGGPLPEEKMPQWLATIQYYACDMKLSHRATPRDNTQLQLQVQLRNSSIAFQIGGTSFILTATSVATVNIRLSKFAFRHCEPPNCVHATKPKESQMPEIAFMHLLTSTWRMVRSAHMQNIDSGMGK